MSMIPEVEKKSQQTIREYQSVQLKKLVQYLNASSPFYKKHFANHRIDVESIQSLEDLL
jgi:phenylacetate-CoA ligase